MMVSITPNRVVIPIQRSFSCTGKCWQSTSHHFTSKPARASLKDYPIMTSSIWSLWWWWCKNSYHKSFVRQENSYESVVINQTVANGHGIVCCRYGWWPPDMKIKGVAVPMIIITCPSPSCTATMHNCQAIAGNDGLVQVGGSDRSCDHAISPYS